MSRFGTNLGYVDELYARYLVNPDAVSEAWREFFADYSPAARAEGPSAALAAPPAAAVEPQVETAPPDAEPLSGIAGKIAENMEASLSVPTATSVRTIAVKLLEENRRVLNQHRASIFRSKISVTHLVAWAIVRALERHPGMNASFVEIAGVPHRVKRTAVNLGFAVDSEKGGERVLLVPSVKGAEALDFPSFAGAYDELIARARKGRLTLPDLEGTTITLTNPGMLGTELSIPRLMRGQGAILGAGAIEYPKEYAGMAPEAISELGLSRVMTLTSTYDHRVVQGAESGAFLATIERLLTGHDGFYERIFRELAVPYEPIGWSSDLGGRKETAEGADSSAIVKQAGVAQLVRSYRVRGHLRASLDPLGLEPLYPYPELELSSHGLTVWDLDRRFVVGRLGETRTLPLREILDTLRETYCRHVGVEFMHIQESEVRRWLEERLERRGGPEELDAADKDRILERLNAAEAFEKFLHSAYVGQKRFSLEGAETLIPMLGGLLDDAASAGVEEAVIGMAHRGRLNVIANVAGKSYGAIFREFEGESDPESSHGSGDVRYHLGASGAHVAPDGREIRVVVASNPSHLEAVDPVVEGMARARQDRSGDLLREKVLPVLIHGDAAFAGQGVVAETLNLSQLKGYRTGGTIHIVVNNQIGFTTGPRDARSSHYATDVARTVQAPIFHVNGDHPEDAVRVTRLAHEFRRKFRRDVVVDLVCYRRWGHNEADDPSYTHPVLYAAIEKKRSVRKLYTEARLRRGDLTPERAESALEDYRARLARAFEDVRQAKTGAEPEPRREREEVEGVARPRVATAAPRDVLARVVEGLDRVPPGFETHPKLAKQLARRREQFESSRIDWALGEALAFGSLALEGTPVRLSGEDSGRGTFSQRHAVLYDHRTGVPYVPLAHLGESETPFQVFDSLLSEFAVMGFEYGYSVEYPEALVLWEAQFGDFVNGAQVVIDQFLVSAEEKWGQKSGLALLLPHGSEGQGPEHSSARVERFLELAARGSIRIAVPTTPAQYFHLLRRQVKTAERKPLVVLTPKSLLRHRDVVSTVEGFAAGSFEEVLDDPAVADPSRVARLVLCCGKLYYELDAHRKEAGLGHVAIVRVEQLYPYPAPQMHAVLSQYRDAQDVVWAQEEPRNMGAWSFFSERTRESLPGDRYLRYAGRPRSSSPAPGSHARHLAEQRALIVEALEGRCETPQPAPKAATRSSGASG
jgi:2-oxoglutarate dehydrogenase E1 component